MTDRSFIWIKLQNGIKQDKKILHRFRIVVEPLHVREEDEDKLLSITEIVDSDFKVPKSFRFKVRAIKFHFELD